MSDRCPDHAERLLREEYGFDDVSICERLEGGYANDLFAVVADGRKLVLRVKHPPAIEDDIAWEHRMTSALSARLREVVAPLTGRAGRTSLALDGRVASLLPFIDGAPADASCESHRLTSLVHGDFFPGNVLVADDRVVGVIDWEEAQADWPVWDLACAIGEFCSVGDDLDRATCDRFARAYRDAGGTASPDDDDLLVPLLRVKRILEVLRAPTDRHPRWEHQRHNLRSLAKLRC